MNLLRKIREQISRQFLPISRRIPSAKKSVLRNKKGQASVEYILLLTLALFTAGKGTKMIIKLLDDNILIVGGRLEKQLKTGRGPLNTWTN